MRYLIFAAATVWLATQAKAQSMPPRYDVAKYCEKVAASIGGSSQIENTCIRQEQSAYNTLKSSWPTIPSKVTTYCDKVASSVGGTYAILRTCIEQETNASSTKPGFQY